MRVSRLIQVNAAGALNLVHIQTDGCVPGPGSEPPEVAEPCADGRLLPGAPLGQVLAVFTYNGLGRLIRSVR